MRVLLAVLTVVACLGGCGGSTSTETRRTSPRDPSAAARRPVTVPAVCDAGASRSAGRIDDATVDELSGLAVARRDPGLLLAVEDSGNAAGITLLQRDGRVLAFLAVPGIANVDWEDVATAPGPGGAQSVFVGDIGDNAARRDTVQVYRLPEPARGSRSAGPATRLDLRYPDGAHDAEALLVDPLRPELVVVTKTLIGATTYVARSDAVAGVPTTLRRGPRIDLGTVTGGSVSADGRIVALRSYGTLAAWRRRGREPLTRTLARSPSCRVRGAFDDEAQGEAIALTRDGRRAYTASEGTRPDLHVIGR